jgi:hypothetical protein
LRFDHVFSEIRNRGLSVRVIHDVIAKTIRTSKLVELDVSGNAKEPRFGRWVVQVVAGSRVECPDEHLAREVFGTINSDLSRDVPIHRSMVTFKDPCKQLWFSD